MPMKRRETRTVGLGSRVRIQLHSPFIGREAASKRATDASRVFQFQ